MKRVKHGLKAYLFLALAIAAFALVNVMAGAIETRFNLSKDMSYNGIATLSEATKQLLQKVERPVTLYVLRVDGLKDDKVEALAAKYQEQCQQLTMEIVDPDRVPGLMKRLGTKSSSIKTGTVIVVSADESKYRIHQPEDFKLYGETAYNGENYTYLAGYQYENILNQSILYVTREKLVTAYFLQGHGEKTIDDSDVFIRLIKDNGFDVKVLGSLAEMEALDSNAIVILFAPSKDITQEETAALKAFFNRGGCMLISRDAGTAQALPNLDGLLSLYGIAYDNALIIADSEDTASYYPSNPAILVSQVGNHDITASIAQDNGIVLSAQCISIGLTGMERNEVRRSVLLSSGKSAYTVDLSDQTRTTIQRAETDPTGAFFTAVAAERIFDFDNIDPNSRIVALGATALVNNASFNASFYNAEFALGAMSWLSKDQVPVVEVIMKPAIRESLLIKDQKTLYVLGGIIILAVPGVILLCGFVVRKWRKRK